MENKSFKPTLGLLDATMIVAGSMIGSGIFIVSADIARNVGSAGWLVLVWLITGFMTTMAALSYGELSGMFPKAGGQYVYLKEAYNPLISFLYGWSFFSVIQTATIAAVGVAFAKFTAYIFPFFSENNVLFDFGFLKINASQLLAIATIILLTFINSRRIKAWKIIQTTFTLTKILSIVGLIIFGFWAADADVCNAKWCDALSLHKLNADKSTESYISIGPLGAIASAIVASIFGSDAGNYVTSI